MKKNLLERLMGAIPVFEILWDSSPRVRTIRIEEV
jgi:hypothetical protein